MPDDFTESRTTINLRTGSKICVLLAIPVVVLAAYWFWVPILIPTADGGMFGCGSAASPPTEAFPKGVCQNIADVNLYRALAALAAAVIVGGLGVTLFGVDRRTEVRRFDADDHLAAGAPRDLDTHRRSADDAGRGFTEPAPRHDDLPGRHGSSGHSAAGPLDYDR